MEGSKPPPVSLAQAGPANADQDMTGANRKSILPRLFKPAWS